MRIGAGNKLRPPHLILIIPVFLVINMRPKIKRFAKNVIGRDFVVGDIHGHFSRLKWALNKVGFNEHTDRLFSVGDLVDRGPESIDVLDWLDKPWFHPVLGNHELMAIECLSIEDYCIRTYIDNGGQWFLTLSTIEQKAYVNAFAELPIVIEVETDHGTAGILHADCPVPQWADLIESLTTDNQSSEWIEAACLWSRKRITAGDETGVAGIDLLVVGHTPLAQPTKLGNVLHIDTKGWGADGYVTLVELNELAFLN